TCADTQSERDKMQASNVIFFMAKGVSFNDYHIKKQADPAVRLLVLFIDRRALRHDDRTAHQD
ncbi:MAG: hypothetical protein MSD82_02505, partial [Prevotella sp.]|nr:hypothetical protein [Prevotella sp.]